MSRTYFKVCGPRADTDAGMDEFVRDHVSRAVKLGLQVRGPYKVRHHRGFWFRAFEFTSKRKRDVVEFDMGFYEPGFFGDPEEFIRRELRRPYSTSHRDD